METYKKIKDLVLSVENDVDKIFNKNQSQAAIRVRAKMQELRALAKDFRQEIQESLKEAQNKEFENR